MQLRTRLPRLFMLCATLLFSAVGIAHGAGYDDDIPGVPLTPPAGATGVVDYNTDPRDLYAVQLFEGIPVTFRVTRTSSGGNYDESWLSRLYPPGATQLGDQYDVAYRYGQYKSTNEYVDMTYTPSVSGVYYLEMITLDDVFTGPAYGLGYGITVIGTASKPSTATLWQSGAASGYSLAPVKGSEIYLEGRLHPSFTTSPLRGRTAVFQSSSDGVNWTDVSSVSSSGDAFVYPVVASTSLWYRWRFDGDGYYTASTGDAMHVVPRELTEIVSWHTNEDVAAPGDEVRLSGSLRVGGTPAFGPSVTLQVSSSPSGPFRDSGLTAGTDFGLFIFTVHPSTTQYYKAVFPGNSTSMPCESAVLKVSVVPAGTMSVAGGAQFVGSSFAIESNVTGAIEMRVRASTNGTTWGSWSDWTAYDPSIDMGVPATSQKWWYQLEYRDEAGNVLALTDDVMVDATAPTTTADAKSVYAASASIKLTATDGSLSGVKRTEWRLDGGGWNSGTVISTSSRGAHRLEVRSTDMVGNVEPAKTVTFEVRHSTNLGVTSPSAPSLAFGSAFAIRGTLTGAGAGIAGKQVILQSANPGAPFTDTALVAITDSRGAFSFSPRPTTKTHYRVRFAGSTGWMTSTQISTVYALPKVRLTRSTSWSTLRKGKTYYAKGYVSPKHSTSDNSKVTIRAYKRASNGKYYFKKSFTASYSYYSSSKTRYRAAVKLTSKGKWKLVAYHAADSKNARTYGSADYVTVK